MLTRRELLRRFALASGAVPALMLSQACGGQDESQPTATQAATQEPAGTTEPVGTTPSDAAPAAAEPEKAKLTLALPSASGHTFLPAWLIQEQTAKEEGLEVEVVSFRGDAASAQALVGGSVDLALQSPNGLINMLSGGQEVVGFYAGFWQTLFWWMADPEIQSWDDVRGKIVGVTTPGSLTDTLTRYALKRNGIDPSEVNLTNAGSSGEQLEALKAGRLHVSCMVKPLCWQAEADGMTILGKQEDDVAPSWPTHIYQARQAFYDENPNTIRAFLRAHVRAIRLAEENPDIAVDVLARNMKIEESLAQSAYDDVMRGFNIQGELPPDDVMSVFWDITIEAGNATERWENSRLLDRRYVDTFDEWAP